MKPRTGFIIIVLAISLAISLLLGPGLTGYFLYAPGNPEEVKIGFCPTMIHEALLLAESNGYGLVAFGSASDVLSALKNGEISKGIIGRKAKTAELPYGARETVIRSGYTLVSNKRQFMDRSQLPHLEIHTYLPDVITESLVPGSLIFYHNSIDEAIAQVNNGKVVLISWDDWRDDFELLVVLEEGGKSRDFRGAFLYET